VLGVSWPKTLWSDTDMSRFSRKKRPARVSERRFRFVVQIAVPAGGFGSVLNAINAWHRYTKNMQRRARPPHSGEEKFSRWCFESLEVAQKFTQRFGGEIVPSAIPGSRRLRPACAVPIGKAVCGSDRGGMRGNA
jgi:hypothetical protein